MHTQKKFVELNFFSLSDIELRNLCERIEKLDDIDQLLECTEGEADDHDPVRDIQHVGMRFSRLLPTVECDKEGFLTDAIEEHERFVRVIKSEDPVSIGGQDFVMGSSKSG